MNATTSALRLAPLALCLALTACGGSSGSDRGKLGTLDPQPLTLDTYAPLAAHMALIIGPAVPDRYNALFLSDLDDILRGCKSHPIIDGDTTRIDIENCHVSDSVGRTHQVRYSNVKLEHQADLDNDPTGNTRIYYIEHLKDSNTVIDPPLQDIKITEAKGTLKLTLTEGLKAVSEANSQYSLLEDRLRNEAELLSRTLYFFRLDDFSVVVKDNGSQRTVEQYGRLTTYVGSIEAYVDIETVDPLIQGENDDCPTSGKVIVTGRDDETMSISFSGIDVTVMIGTTSQDYPLDCTEFLDWIAPDAI